MSRTARTVLQLGALVLLLIVFPAASWYYLNSGLNYRKSTMAELKDYGTFPQEGWMLTDGSALSADFLDRKMLLVHLMPDGSREALVSRYGEILQRLHDQFEERKELLFLTLLEADSAEAARRSLLFAETYELTGQQQQFFLRVDEGSAPRAERIVVDANPLENTEPSAFFLLTDTTATVRRYYDVRDDAEIKRLVEHIALLLPFKKDRELIFKREVEK